MCVGLVIIGIISALWIRQSTIEHRLHTMTIIAEEWANRIIHNDQDQLETRGGELPEFQPERFNSNIYITNLDGRIIQQRTIGFQFVRAIPQDILQKDNETQKIQLSGRRGETETLYLVKVPVIWETIHIGWVVVTQPEREVAAVDQEYHLLIVMLISLALLGWGVIYYISRKLSDPIKSVASAAKQIQAGEYTVKLNENDINEKEVYELVHSFKDMAGRLDQLEAIRTELLAGVTHELKTPVTSISGLLQALKDEVVTGEEAAEFLDISLKETNRMQMMIRDLLEFNSFASGQFPVKKEWESINHVVFDIVNQWNLTEGNNNWHPRVIVNPLENDVSIPVDILRLQQIIINLLNNAKQALEGEGEITISLNLNQDFVVIFVEDTGAGIPQSDQEMIFERFYRGENKKYKVRGLGLGLPFSKMLAKAHNGDLQLVESKPHDGTTFKIELPRNDSGNIVEKKG
nr:HAMP domain-containing sensor histidine kinase [Evansella tamaricis]